MTMYMNTNKLADSERDSVTFEDVKEDIRAYTLDDRRNFEQQATWEMLIKKTEVSFNGIGDKQLAGLIADLMMPVKQALSPRLKATGCPKKRVLSQRLVKLKTVRYLHLKAKKLEKMVPQIRKAKTLKRMSAGKQRIRAVPESTKPRNQK